MATSGPARPRAASSVQGPQRRVRLDPRLERAARGPPRSCAWPPPAPPPGLGLRGGVVGASRSKRSPAAARRARPQVGRDRHRPLPGPSAPAATASSRRVSAIPPDSTGSRAATAAHAARARRRRRQAPLGRRHRRPASSGCLRPAPPTPDQLVPPPPAPQQVLQASTSPSTSHTPPTQREPHPSSTGSRSAAAPPHRGARRPPAWSPPSAKPAAATPAARVPDPRWWGRVPPGLGARPSPGVEVGPPPGVVVTWPGAAVWPGVGVWTGAAGWRGSGVWTAARTTSRGRLPSRVGARPQVGRVRARPRTRRIRIALTSGGSGSPTCSRQRAGLGPPGAFERATRSIRRKGRLTPPGRGRGGGRGGVPRVEEDDRGPGWWRRIQV